MIRHQRYHWLLVLAVLALAVFAWREVHGQTTTNAATFMGRPAMAGANPGTGAMAGPPQGGIGVQGSEGFGLNLQRPQLIAGRNDMPQGQLDTAERRGLEDTASTHAERQQLLRAPRELPPKR